MKTTRSALQIKRLLKVLKLEKASAPKIPFDSITLVDEDDNEAIISFRGKDRKGVLLSAASALYGNGLEVRWARVHTWGRQIDDVFCVLKTNDFVQKLQDIQLNFQADQLPSSLNFSSDQSLTELK